MIMMPNFAGPDQLLPVAGKDKVYDEVQEEIATWERSLEEELEKLEKQVGLVGLMFRPLLYLTFSLDSASPTGTVISGIRYRFAARKCLGDDVNRPCAGYLPGPDKGRSEEGTRGLDQERGYQGGIPLYRRPQSTRTDRVDRLPRDGRLTPSCR